MNGDGDGGRENPSLRLGVKYMFADRRTTDASFQTLSNPENNKALSVPNEKIGKLVMKSQTLACPEQKKGTGHHFHATTYLVAAEPGS